MLSGRRRFAARRPRPRLSYDRLLRIEEAFQYVVRRSVAMSELVWRSLSATERALMLEPFTIGVPSGDGDDPESEVPLLNCVQNTVLGVFGNCLVMPFFIPESVARAREMSTRDIQEALLNFHRQAFAPAKSAITLPTAGVLGEAVLGHCAANEKIDLTRFWNWQDSPMPAATDPTTLLPEAKLASGLLSGSLSAPNSLTTSTPVSPGLAGAGAATHPPPSGGLAAALVGEVGESAAATTLGTSAGDGGSAALQLAQTTMKSAGAARADALAKTSTLTSGLLNQVGKLIDAETAERKAEAAKVEEEKAQEEKDKAAAKQALRDQYDAGMAQLLKVPGIQSLAALIGAAPESLRGATAGELVGEMFGGQSLDLLDQATAYGALTIGEKDPEAVRDGKIALAEALGLEPPIGP